LRCFDEEIAVLNALGNALERHQFTDIIKRQKGTDLFRP